MELTVDTKVKKYFDMVQDKIKELIGQDPKYKGIDPQLFNDLMVTQGDSPEKDDQRMSDFAADIKKACERGDDIETVAKSILDTDATRVKTNAFNKDAINDVPNQLQQEKVFRYLKTYEKFQ